MDCKAALEEAGGDMNMAADILRKKGVLKAAKRADKVAAEGIVASYIHGGGKIGVLLELNCETDFVARTDEFTSLAKDVAMQVTAANPSYIGREEVPQERVQCPPGTFFPEPLRPPRPLKILFVGVAPPRKGRHFYSDPDDGLRRGLFRVLGELGTQAVPGDFGKRLGNPKLFHEIAVASL